MTLGTLMSRKRVKNSILLNSEGFDRLDACYQERGFKKSMLIARLIRHNADESVFDGQPKPPTNQDRTHDFKHLSLRRAT